MHVAGQNLRRDIENPLYMFDCHAEKIVGSRIFQISDVLTKKRTIAGGQTERVLEFRPAGQHRPERPTKKNRNRNNTP